MYLKIAAAIVLIVFFAVLLEVYRELHCFQTVTYRVTSEKLCGIGKPKKIVFLSDLHNQVYGRKNEPLIEKIREIDPDLVLIGGDMLIGKPDVPYDPALYTVREIAGTVPVFYANGNHEQRMKEVPEEYGDSYEEYKKRLERSGVCFLENETRDFLFERCGVHITGLEIPSRCYTHFHREQLDLGEIRERIGDPEKEVYEILLAHNPSYMDRYLEWGADLVLSGHLHGGIVRIPGLTGLISPAFDLFPKYSGDHYQKDDRDIIVSKGIGIHTVRVRFLNPAEIVVIELSGKNDSI